MPNTTSIGPLLISAVRIVIRTASDLRVKAVVVHHLVLVCRGPNVATVNGTVPARPRPPLPRPTHAMLTSPVPTPTVGMTIVKPSPNRIQPPSQHRPAPIAAVGTKRVSSVNARQNISIITLNTAGPTAGGGRHCRAVATAGIVIFLVVVVRGMAAVPVPLVCYS